MPPSERDQDGMARSFTSAQQVSQQHWQVGGKISAKFRQIFARFRLYRRRSLQVNTRSATLLKIYQII